MDEEPRSIAREYLEALIVAAIFLAFTNTFIFKTFYIPSGSMEETLLIGDHLFVNRFIYGPATSELERKLTPTREVRRGDIVVFRSPMEPKIDLVKRCIAVAGDQVRMLDKKLILNGEVVDDKSYAQYQDPGLLPRRDRWGPIVVPENHVFCLGDNRDRSNDSRYWGTLPLEMVKGKAFMIYWSYGGETSDGQWRGWQDRIGQLFGTVKGFFSKTRWSRSFRLIR